MTRWICGRGALALLTLCSIASLVACGGGGDDQVENAGVAGGTPTACTIVDELRTALPSSFEIVGSPEWYGRMASAADLYRQLQRVAPDDVAGDLDLIVVAQDELLAELEPVVAEGGANSAEATRLVDEYVARADLAEPGAAFATYLESLETTCS